MKVIVKGCSGEVPDNCTAAKCSSKGTRCIYGNHTTDIVLNKVSPWPFWVCDNHVEIYVLNGYIELKDWQLVQ